MQLREHVISQKKLGALHCDQHRVSKVAPETQSRGTPALPEAAAGVGHRE